MVITLASHARGRGFDPRRNLVLNPHSWITTHGTMASFWEPLGHALSAHFSAKCSPFFKTVSAARFWHCRNPGLNRGPLDLQSNALPTELFRPTRASKMTNKSVHAYVHCPLLLHMCRECPMCLIAAHPFSDCLSDFPYGLVVRIPAFHAGGPGSIPGVGASTFSRAEQDPCRRSAGTNFSLRGHK